MTQLSKPFDITEGLNNYFINTVSNIAQTIISQRDLLNLDPSITSTFYLLQTTKDEITHIINHREPAAAGIYKITVEIIRSSVDYIASPLSIIIILT